MKTLSQILIEVAKDPSSVNKIAAWDELVKNKKRYPLAQLEFAKEYLGVITHDELGDCVETKGAWMPNRSVGSYSCQVSMTEEEYKKITDKSRMYIAGLKASKAGKDLRKAIEACMLNDKKDSFLVKIVKKLTKMVEKLNQRLNWFYRR